MQPIEAIYENGLLRPLSPLHLPERAHVQILINQPTGTADDELTLAEFDRLLDELSTDGVAVSGTFSRAEIYADHD